MPEADGDNSVAVPDRPDKDSEAAESTESPYKDRFWTIPNVICIGRIIGSLVLLVMAFRDYPTGFAVMYVILHLSDWIDGKLARWLNQRSDFGARLDSASDAVLYSCLLLGCLVLKWEVLRQEALWLAAPLIAYGVTSGYGLWKYGRIPSYHTYGAKWTQWLVLAGALALLLDWSLWPLRIATVAGTLTNLEATLITYLLPEWHADVLSLRHALKEKEKPDTQAE